MDLENIVVKLISTKNYDFELSEAIKELLPEMVGIFGKEKTIKFFEEYTLVPRNRTGLNNSGATNKEQKIIEFAWSIKDRHEAINALIHEAGHALGALETEQNYILMEGFEYREAFLTKLEEAVVSEKQDELGFGEMGYNYVVINNPKNGEDYHRNNFKTQPSHKYTINKVSYLKLVMMKLWIKEDNVNLKYI